VQTAELRERFASSAVARLATVRPDGAPHLVPVVFALVDGTVYSAVDAKPKRTRRLQRLANVRAEPRCALLVDHYEDDWSMLWWVRADGTAAVVEDPEVTHPGLRALAARHPQYRVDPPAGPLLVVTVEHWSGWSGGSS
jgi:PPOX class probable F420-dependent enzyme